MGISGLLWQEYPLSAAPFAECNGQHSKSYYSEQEGWDGVWVDGQHKLVQLAISRG